MDRVEEHLIDIKTALGTKAEVRSEQPKPQGDDAAPYKTMIAIGTTIIGVLITGIITLVIKLS